MQVLIGSCSVVVASMSRRAFVLVLMVPLAIHVPYNIKNIVVYRIDEIIRVILRN